MSKDFGIDQLPEGMVLSDDFGDPECLFNSRDWLQSAMERAGAKVIGKGVGCGEADLDVVIEGHSFNVRIKAIDDH